MPPRTILTVVLVLIHQAALAAPLKRVLFFSKAASWEQKIVHRDGDHLSYIERALDKLGRDHRIEFTFSKDGTIFTADKIASFDAFFFFTSGDLTYQDRNGRGDNYPLMTVEGKKLFLDAVRNGKGFIGCNTANYTFIEAVSPGENNDPEHAWRYTRMIGSGYLGHNEVQKGQFSHIDRRFPGMERLPGGYAPIDQWYAFNRLAPDLHVIMALASGKLTGNLYERPDYPVVWARMEGKGRVYYTTMGHTAEIWQDSGFLQMLLGGIRWTTGLVDANIPPDISTVTPRATEIPPRAARFIASNPPADNPHFPGFKVWLDHDYRIQAPKRVLFFTKSAGYEHPILYRDTAWPSPLEKEMLEFGQEHKIDFVFSKDGKIFTPSNLEQYDAFVFYTSGDPTDQPRNGLGDNYPLMTSAGKQALLHAIRQGKGFIGLHSAIDTFSSSPSDPYGRMLGASSANHGLPSQGRLTVQDRSFPGMDRFPANLVLPEDGYSPRDLAAGLHITLALSTKGQKIPVAWARTEGSGRVWYTSLGHAERTWRNTAFRRMFLGALQWTTGLVNGGSPPLDNRRRPGQ